MPRSGRVRDRDREIADRASMRPGQSCPGVVRKESERHANDYCFNEAGAIMPRSGLQRFIIAT